MQIVIGLSRYVRRPTKKCKKGIRTVIRSSDIFIKLKKNIGKFANTLLNLIISIIKQTYFSCSQNLFLHMVEPSVCLEMFAKIAISSRG